MHALYESSNLRKDCVFKPKFNSRMAANSREALNNGDTM